MAGQGMLFLADTSALLHVNSCVPYSLLADLFESISPLVGEQFGFPLAVRDELLVFAREERITGWAQGISDRLRMFTPNLRSRRWVVRRAQLDLGWEEGLSTVDGRDPSMLCVAGFARQCLESGREVTVVTEDSGRPFAYRPRMSELCEAFGWIHVPMRKCLHSLGLGHIVDGT